ncbi:hypothetical protein LPB79_13740 [Rhizobium sp. T136]|uniref:hypothetical protein n=1 Tax=Rhizobium TaxID=379 RepID=UPI00139173F3|nr:MULTISPECIES: hypothetical protein [Rhizobium]UFS83305.1 hypothetical protein LPB79_13740 [Rhizobium sp. T136]
MIRYGAKSTRKAEIEHQYRDGSNTSDKRLELAFIIGELRCCEGDARGIDGVSGRVGRRPFDFF